MLLPLVREHVPLCETPSHDEHTTFFEISPLISTYLLKFILKFQQSHHIHQYYFMLL